MLFDVVVRTVSLAIRYQGIIQENFNLRAVGKSFTVLRDNDKPICTRRGT